MNLRFSGCPREYPPSNTTSLVFGRPRLYVPLAGPVARFPWTFLPEHDVPWLCTKVLPFQHELGYLRASTSIRSPCGAYGRI